MRVAPGLAALFLLISTIPSPGAAPKAGPEALIEKITARIAPLKSHPARMKDHGLLVEVSGLAAEYKGVVLKVTDGAGRLWGVAIIEEILPDKALCRILDKNQGARPGSRLLVSGFSPPVRIYLALPKRTSGNYSQWHGAIMEAALDSGALGVWSGELPDSFSSADARKGDDFKAFIEEEIQNSGARLAVIPSARVDGNEVSLAADIFADSGNMLFSVTSTVPAKGENAKKASPEESQKPEAEKTGEVRREDFFINLESAVTASLTDAGPKPALPIARGWNSISVDGMVTSAAVYYTGGVVMRDIAILSSGRLFLAEFGEEDLILKWVSKPFQGAAPLSLAVNDTNGDGREEIFVNAWKDGDFSSMLFDKDNGKYQLILGGLKYYFSGAHGGMLFAQRLDKNGAVDKQAFLVSREKGDIRLDPYFTTEDEAPLGLFGLGEGYGEGKLVAGTAQNGDLLVFSSDGRLLYKAVAAGGIGKRPVTRINADGRKDLYIPPRIVALTGKDGKRFLAVGRTMSNEDSFLDMNQNKTAQLRLITLSKDGYSVEKTYEARKNWLCDLLDLKGGLLAYDHLPGYIVVKEDNTGAEIYLPPDGDEKGVRKTPEGSSSGRGKRPRDRK